MKPATLALGVTGMAMAFAGGIVALPALVFLAAAAAGPVLVLGTLVGIAWLARPRLRPKARPLRPAIAAGPLPGVQCPPKQHDWIDGQSRDRSLAVPADKIKQRGCIDLVPANNIRRRG